MLHKLHSLNKLHPVGIGSVKRNEDANKDKEPGSVLFLEKNKFFATKTDTILKFQIKGESHWYNDPKYDIVLSSSNSKLKISTKSWTGEDEYILNTIVFLENPSNRNSAEVTS